MLTSFVHLAKRSREIASAIQLFDVEIFLKIGGELGFVEGVKTEDHAVGGENHETLRIHVDERHHHALVGCVL